MLCNETLVYHIIILAARDNNIHLSVCHPNCDSNRISWIVFVRAFIKTHIETHTGEQVAYVAYSENGGGKGEPEINK